MRNTTRMTLPLAGLLALAGTGCANMGGKSQPSAQNPTAARVETSQEESQKALKEAHDAQAKASEEEKKAAEAQADVQKKQQELQQAQQKAEQEQAKAQQAQSQAQVTTQQSAQQAQQAQQQASQALNEQSSQVRSGQQTIAGQVTQATPERLAIKAQSGDTMTFRITDQTQVLIDGRRGTATDIQRGEDARVSYELGGTQATALHVMVMTGNPSGAGASGSSSTADESTSGASRGNASPASPDGAQPGSKP